MQQIQPYFDIVPKGDQMTVAELLLRYLDIEEVHDIFGVPGTPLTFLLKALRESDKEFTYHICRQETGAGYMADGYARVTGKLGVVVVSAGPSATNALTGSAVAQACNSAVLTISGEVARSAFGRGGFQEGIDSTLDIHSVYSSADIYSTVITDPSNFQTLFCQSLRACLSLPRQAAHVSLPADVGGDAIGQDVYIPKSPYNYRAVPRGRDSAAAKEVMGTLAAAQRPLLYLGNGCRHALLGSGHIAGESRKAIDDRRAAFQELTRKFALPVTTTPNAKGVFPERNPMSLRNYGFGGGGLATAYVTADASDAAGGSPTYDALVVLSSSLGEKSTDSWAPALIPKGPIYQVDLNQAVIGRGFPITKGIVAEVGGFLDDLIEFGDKIVGADPVIGRRRQFIEKLKQDHQAPPANSPEAQLVLALGQVLPKGSHLFIDASLCAIAALQYMTIDPPTEMHNAFPMEPMGWAPAAVVGAAIGMPDRVCVSLSGDGGFMMNGNEVSTAARYKVGCIWVVHYNDTLAAVEEHLEHEFHDPSWMGFYKLGAPQLAEFARGLGADAVEVPGSGFKHAFTDAVVRARGARKPQVIVVKG